MAKKGWRSKAEYLTAKERRSLPGSDFALPGRGKGPEGKGSGSYPIPDEKHGRAALSMVSRYGSSDEKAKVRSAVARKFPDIGEKSRSATRYRSR